MADKPTTARIVWLRDTKPLNQYQLSHEVTLDYLNDSDAVTDGTQNVTYIENVPHDPANETIDVFVVPEGPGLRRPALRWNDNTDIRTTLASSMVEGENTALLVAPSNVGSFQAGDRIVIGTERMKISTITTGVTYSAVVRRGLYGTSSAETHATGAAVTLTQVSLQNEDITLSGSTSSLPTPSSFAVYGIHNGFHLSWTWNATAEEIARCRRFVLFWDTSASVDTSDSRRGITADGNDRAGEWYPRTAQNLPWTGQTFYMRVAAEDLVGNLSDLSNEANGQIWGSVEPRPPSDPPPTPDVTLSVTTEWECRAEARRPSSTAALGVANVKQCTFEFYYAMGGNGNPTTGSVDGYQVLLDTVVDSASPYAESISVTTNGFGDYWCRAKFTDENDVDGSWGLSENKTISAGDYSMDQTVVSASDIETNFYLGGDQGSYVYYTVSWGALGYDSIYDGRYKYREDADGADFSAGSEDPFTGSEWESQTYYMAEALAWTDVVGIGSRQGSFQQILSLPKGGKFEISFALKNRIGWSNWTTPIELHVPMTDLPDATETGWFPDTGVAIIEKFNAWTQSSPPPGGDQGDIQGNWVRFGVELGDNSASVFSFQVIGWKSTETEPSETVELDDTSYAAYASHGTTQVTISGYTAGANEFDDHWFRIGKKSGVHTWFGTRIQEWKIASHTTGDPFVLTLAGAYVIAHPTTDATDPIDDWQVYDEPVYQKALENGGFHKEYWVHGDGYVGGTWVDKTPHVAQNFYENIKNATTMYFKCRVHNIAGRTAWKYADNTVNGTYTAGSVVAKTISYISTGDIAADAITAAKIASGAVDSTVIPRDLMPIGHDIELVATDNNSLNCNGGNIYFKNGASQTITSATINLGVNDTTYWLYASGQGASTALEDSTTVTDATPSGNTIVALVVTTSDTNELCSIIPRWGKGTSIAAQSIACAKLSAISADMGSITAGTVTGATIRTAGGTGQRIVLNNSALTTYDSGNDKRVEIPLSADQIKFYDTNGAYCGFAGGYAADTFGVGAGDDLYLGIGSAGLLLVHQSIHLGSATFFVDVKPSSDDAYTLGSAGARWSDVRTVLLNGADICLENGWKLRELGLSDRDVGKPPEWVRENHSNGVQLMDTSGDVMAVFHKDGNIYLRGKILGLSELPSGITS